MSDFIDFNNKELELPKNLDPKILKPTVTGTLIEVASGGVLMAGLLSPSEMLSHVFVGVCATFIWLALMDILELGTDMFNFAFIACWRIETGLFFKAEEIQSHPAVSIPFQGLYAAVACWAGYPWLGGLIALINLHRFTVRLKCRQMVHRHFAAKEGGEG